MTRTIAWLAALTVAMILQPGNAQKAPSPLLSRIDAPAQPNAIPLYPDAPQTGPTERWNRALGQTIVRNVTRPTITPFLPDPAKATGLAVIVAPGGGFKMLSMDNEGWPVAKWLADHGIAAFVLKYRLNETADDDATFGRQVMQMFADAARGAHAMVPTEPRSTQDALAALRYVRSNAARWKVDPTRVGMIGFSAGAITTLNAISAGAPADRPAFAGYIYGPMTAIAVPADAPPMFAALAMDDELFGAQGFGIVEAWREAGRPVELHAYEKGGHGFGMGKAGTTSTLLMDEFHAWLRGRGLLTAQKTSDRIKP
jgi:acetyl esterase/lipase